MSTAARQGGIYLLGKDYTYRSLVLDRDEVASFLDLFGTGQAIEPPLPTARLVPLSDEWSDSPGMLLPDFTCLYRGGCPCFSDRAVNALSEVLVANGQLIPMECHDAVLYLYNVTRVIDALDRHRSQIDYFARLKSDPRPRAPREVRQYAFHLEHLTDATIFKLPEFLGTEVYVTDRFAKLVQDAQLTGFAFHQVWPWPDPGAERRKFLEKRLRKRGKKRS